MDDDDIVKRSALYDKVWKTLNDIAKTAAPGSITPETFARISVDVVMSELRRAGAIVAVYRNQTEDRR